MSDNQDFDFGSVGEQNPGQAARMPPLQLFDSRYYRCQPINHRYLELADEQGETLAHLREPYAKEEEEDELDLDDDDTEDDESFDDEDDDDYDDEDDDEDDELDDDDDD